MAFNIVIRFGQNSNWLVLCNGLVFAKQACTWTIMATGFTWAKWVMYSVCTDMCRCVLVNTQRHICANRIHHSLGWCEACDHGLADGRASNHAVAWFDRQTPREPSPIQPSWDLDKTWTPRVLCCQGNYIPYVGTTLNPSLNPTWCVCTQLRTTFYPIWREKYELHVMFQGPISVRWNPT